MDLSFPQTYESFIFLSLKNLNFGAEICLEIEDVFKFDSLEACNKGKKATVGWLKDLNLPKIQIFKFRKIKGLMCLRK